MASQVWCKPFLTKGILRNLLEGPPSNADRLRTAKGFFSTALLLDDTPTLASRLALRKGHSSTSLDRAVFEEELEEYFQDDTAFPPSSVPLSTPLGQHASASANRLTKDRSHPLQQVDATLFEAVSEEYLEDTEGAPMAKDSSRDRWGRSHRIMLRNTGLKSLIIDGDFARAESLLEELYKSSNVHIKRDVIYAEAALHAWKTEPVDQRTERFYDWFSLMPNASLGRIRRARIAIQRVRQELFSEPNDLNTIACFGLIAARKGFAKYVAIDVIAHIARFASPGVSSAFFDQIEMSAQKFYSRFHNQTVESSSFSIWNAEKWHNMFIRTLCFAGYVDAAVDRTSYVLRSPQNVPVAPFTWSILLEELTKSRRPDLLGVVRELRAGVTCDRQKPFSGMPNSSDGTPHPPSSKSITPIGISEPSGILSKPLGDVNHTPAPASDSFSATYLAGMINHYIESGQIEDVADLRQEMMGSDVRSDLWVTAQIKFYLDRRQYVVILRQFMKYYTCIGVPKEMVDPYVQEGSLWLRGEFDNIHASLPVISSTNRRSPNRWPSTHVLTMVWQSMVSLAKDLPSLQVLYRSFLKYFDDNHPSTSLERPAISSKRPLISIRFQYPPVMKPDTVYFQIFIVAFARLAGADAAMQVLADMQARNIRPDVHNWTALAGHFAEQSELQSAERILGRMEATLEDDQVAPASSSVSRDKIRTPTGPISRPTGWIPRPNLVTYTTILRGLVDRGRIEDARKFEERMKAAGYIPGSDERSDSVIELLRSRERTPRVSWHNRAQSGPWYVATVVCRVCKTYF